MEIAPPLFKDEHEEKVEFKIYPFAELIPIAEPKQLERDQHDIKVKLLCEISN